MKNIHKPRNQVAFWRYYVHLFFFFFYFEGIQNRKNSQNWFLEFVIHLKQVSYTLYYLAARTKLCFCFFKKSYHTFCYANLQLWDTIKLSSFIHSAPKYVLFNRSLIITAYTMKHFSASI